MLHQHLVYRALGHTGTIPSDRIWGNRLLVVKESSSGSQSVKRRKTGRSDNRWLTVDGNFFELSAITLTRRSYFYCVVRVVMNNFLQSPWEISVGTLEGRISSGTEELTMTFYPVEFILRQKYKKSTQYKYDESCRPCDRQIFNHERAVHGIRYDSWDGNSDPTIDGGPQILCH